MSRSAPPRPDPAPVRLEPALNSALRTQPRFPADVAAALKQAGWHPGRWQIRQAEEWADALVAHGSPDGVQHAVFPAAIEAWAEFGGLAVELTGAGREIARTPFLLDPRCGLHQPRTLADLGRALGSRVAPLARRRTARRCWPSTRRAGCTAWTTPASGTWAVRSTRRWPPWCSASGPNG